MKRKNRKKFIAFLKKHGALKRYIADYYGARTADRPPLKIRLKKIRESTIISGAFIWQKSLNGHDYWSNLDKLWQEELNNG